MNCTAGPKKRCTGRCGALMMMLTLPRLWHENRDLLHVISDRDAKHYNRNIPCSAGIWCKTTTPKISNNLWNGGKKAQASFHGFEVELNCRFFDFSLKLMSSNWRARWPKERLNYIWLRMLDFVHYSNICPSWCVRRTLYGVHGVHASLWFQQIRRFCVVIVVPKLNN